MEIESEAVGKCAATLENNQYFIDSKYWACRSLGFKANFLSLEIFLTTNIFFFMIKSLANVLNDRFNKQKVQVTSTALSRFPRKVLDTFSRIQFDHLWHELCAFIDAYLAHQHIACLTPHTREIREQNRNCIYTRCQFVEERENKIERDSLLIPFASWVSNSIECNFIAHLLNHVTYMNIMA